MPLGEQFVVLVGRIHENHADHLGGVAAGEHPHQDPAERMTDDDERTRYSSRPNQGIEVRDHAAGRAWQWNRIAATVCRAGRS